MKKLNIFLLFCIFCVSSRSQAEWLPNGFERSVRDQGFWPKSAGLGPVVIQHPMENTTQDQTKFYDTQEECEDNISNANVVCVFASSGANAGKYYAEGMGLISMPRRPNAGETTALNR